MRPKNKLARRTRPARYLYPDDDARRVRVKYIEGESEATVRASDFRPYQACRDPVANSANAEKY